MQTDNHKQNIWLLNEKEKWLMETNRVYMYTWQGYEMQNETHGSIACLIILDIEIPEVDICWNILKYLV